MIDERQDKFILNPFDEYAVEEAIGVDHAVWLHCQGIHGSDPYVYAQVLSRWLRDRDYDLIFCGKEAIDDAASEVPGRVAEALDLPQVNSVSSLGIEDGKVTATRDIEGGREIIEVGLPCLLSAQKGLNEPRYPSMRRIMHARKMKIETITLDDLDLSPESFKPITHVEGYMMPPPRQEGRVLSGSDAHSVAELLGILRQEKIIVEVEEQV